jgi:hypothetical protein
LLCLASEQRERCHVGQLAADRTGCRGACCAFTGRRAYGLGRGLPAELRTAQVPQGAALAT